MTQTTERPSWELPHARGSILWRGRAVDGRYEVRLRERPGAPQTSTYIVGPRTRATYMLAEAQLAERIGAASKGERHVGRTLTVGAYLDRWIADKGDLKGDDSHGSRRAYKDRIDLYLKPTVGRYKLADLTVEDVERELGKLTRVIVSPRQRTVASVGTMNAAYRVLSSALGDAVARGKATRNACDGANLATRTAHVEPPTLAEVDALFGELRDDPLFAAFSLQRETGARIGEVLGLDWRGVDLEAGLVTYVKQGSDGTRRSLKNGRARTVAIPPYIIELLDATPYRDRSGFVFRTRTGEPVDTRNALRRFDAALERLGIAPDEDADLDKYRPHDLRHAFVTMLLEAGVDESVTMAWTGHRSSQSLARYSHVRAVTGGSAYRRLVDVWGGEDELARVFRMRFTRRVTGTSDTQTDTQPMRLRAAG